MISLHHSTLQVSHAQHYMGTPYYSGRMGQMKSVVSCWGLRSQSIGHDIDFNGCSWLWTRHCHLSQVLSYIQKDNYCIWNKGLGY